MNKVKTFIRYEFKAVWGVMLVYAVMLIAAYVALSINIANQRETYLNPYEYLYIGNEQTFSYFYSNIFLSSMSKVFSVFGIIIIVPIAMCTMQFINYHNRGTGEFLSVIPVKKKIQYRTKMATGIMAITLPYIPFVMAIIILRFNNVEWINRVNMTSVNAGILNSCDSLKVILIYMLMIWMAIITTYMITFLVQIISGNVVSGMAIIIGIIMSPQYLYSVINNIAIRFMNTWFMENPYTEFLSIRGYTQDSQEQNIKVVTLSDNPFIKIGIMAAVGIVALILSYVAYIKVDTSKKDVLIRVPVIKQLCMIIISVYAGLIISRINNSGRFGFVPLCMVMVLVSFLVYSGLNYVFRYDPGKTRVGRKKHEKK